MHSEGSRQAGRHIHKIDGSLFFARPNLIGSTQRNSCFECSSQNLAESRGLSHRKLIDPQ